MFGVDDPEVAASVRAYVKLMRAARTVLGRVEPLLASHDLTPTQLGVLEALLHKGALTHRELGRKVLTSAGNLTDVIDKLQGRGLVARVRDDVDRRLVRVALTQRGQDLIRRVFPAHAADIGRAMAALTPADLLQLDELLRRLGRGGLATTADASHLTENRSISNKSDGELR